MRARHRRLTGQILDYAIYIACALILFAAIIISIGVARAHGIYSGVMEDGILCCGDQDCEPLQNDQIHEKNGAFVIDSKRYGAPILLPTHRIKWRGVPGEVPGTAGHICAAPRTNNPERYALPTTDDQPDPTYWIYCVWINPGGV